MLKKFFEQIDANEKLSAEEKASFKKFYTDMQEMAQKSAEGLVKKEEITSLSDQVKAFESKLSVDGKPVAEYFKAMQAQMDVIEAAQKALKFTPNEETKTFAQSIRENLTKEAENIKGMTRNSVKAIQLEVKSFLETANASITTGSLLPVPQFETGVTKAPDRMPFILDLITRGNASSLTVYWNQRKTRTDGTEWTAEGVAAANAAVLGYETKSASMQNLSAWIKVSNNSIDDIDWLISEVQTELITLFILKLDADLLNGTVALNGFDGVYTSATAFNADGDTCDAGIVPNKIDAIMFALTQVSIAKYNPSAIILHPADVRDMKLTRDKDGSYLFPTQLGGQIVNVDGVRIISNVGVTKGSFLVGDFSKAKFWSRKGMELKIWEQNENDVLTQLKTVTLYMRGTLIVKDPDKLAFVKGVFEDVIPLITNPGA